MESRNASFFENIFPCLMKETGILFRLDEEVVQDKRQRDDNDLHDERQDQLKEEEVEPRRSKRTRTEKSFGPDFVSFMVKNEPTSYREAELVDLPPGCKPLGYKWIFKKKMKVNCTINKYKARLVIKGYRQRKYVRSGCTTALNVVPWETDGESVLREAMTNTQTPPHATTVVIPTGAPATNTVANHAERPEKFNGQNFKRWQQKMFFYLTTLGLARFLKETVPRVEPPAKGQSSNAQAVQAVEAWKHLDFLCHNYVLNGLIDPLYNVYCKTTTAKELWESLERKYKTEDAGTKKFVVARFLDYKMVDSKNVISQVQDLQVLLHDIHAEGMTLSETFQVAAIIEKLPPSWVEFKNYLKHKRKEMSVEDLVVRLRIEEDNKLAQKDTYAPDSAKANMVEHAGSSSRSNSKGKGKDKKKNDKKGKGKSEYLAPKAGIVKQKFQGTCYNCDQPGSSLGIVVGGLSALICIMPFLFTAVVGVTVVIIVAVVVVVVVESSSVIKLSFVIIVHVKRLVYELRNGKFKKYEMKSKWMKPVAFEESSSPRHPRVESRCLKSMLLLAKSWAFNIYNLILIKGKGKSEYLAPKAGIVKQKFQGTCYNCDQPGHRYLLIAR
ncbi:pol polyprotein [Tanacetum coccineum]